MCLHLSTSFTLIHVNVIVYIYKCKHTHSVYHNSNQKKKKKKKKHLGDNTASLLLASSCTARHLSFVPGEPSTALEMFHMSFIDFLIKRVY